MISKLKLFLAQFQVHNTPQQNNGSDCGLYALAISEFLASKYLKAKDGSMQGEITPQYITGLRTTIKNHILSKCIEKKNVPLFSLKKKNKN